MMALQMTRGKVPHFSMLPHPVVLGTLILVLVGGLLIALSFFAKDEGTGVYRQKGIFTLIVTGIVTLFITIIATSKLWYPHLWKKNSTHKRHHQHTQHHPSVRQREYQRNRR
jgi:hypothetical protein